MTAPRRVLLHAIRDSGAGGPAITIGGIGAWRLLWDKAAAAGWDVVSLEDYTRTTLAPWDVALWDYGSLAVPPPQLRGQAARVIAWSLESPLIAHRAFHRMPRIGQESAHVFGWSGARRLMEKAPATFHDLHWPSERHPAPDAPDWQQRRLLSVVNSNKRAHHWRDAAQATGAVQGARILVAAGLARSYRLRGKWSAPELYHQRLAAIAHFSASDDFDLYGAGWDLPVPGGDRRIAVAVARSYRGTTSDKAATLAQSRFSLVVENTSFPGYVSEKVFDCLLAGTIPVYLGAPDIQEHLPPDSFVDLREVDGPASLERRLRGMTPEEGHRMLAAGRRFVQSSAFERFSAERFASRVWSTVEGVASAPAAGTD